MAIRLSWIVKFHVITQLAPNSSNVARWHGKGTHQGEFIGIAPTGKSFYYGGITILSLQPDGKITKAWVYNDLADAIAKLKE